ncbi:MAG: glycosyltransferase, partial [Candidatus Cloacimonetes bacterium]|nr:glycosyltransferase [Candidatus Cloacimonadota bacterium]
MAEISIIVRAYNDIHFIGRTLSMIKKQTRQDFELIVVDSGSRDGTWEEIKKYNPDIAYQVTNYVPGRVLNEAVEKASGNVIVFNNSDCVPQNIYWLENLTRKSEDENIAAVFGNQLSRPDAHPLVRKDNERAFGDGKLAASWSHFFSLATSAVPCDLLKKYPFNPSIQYSEDIEWSWKMKKLGYKIVYVADAVVEHSHDYTLPQVWQRFHGEGIAEGEIYQQQPSFSGMVVKPVLAELVRDFIYIMRSGEFKVLLYAPLYRIFQRM